ncbi:hypothetical protein WOLCODRAFT_161737, partial [Wolfiporia cocos MD-104 SS10]
MSLEFNISMAATSKDKNHRRVRRRHNVQLQTSMDTDRHNAASPLDFTQFEIARALDDSGLLSAHSSSSFSLLPTNIFMHIRPPKYSHGGLGLSNAMGVDDCDIPETPTSTDSAETPGVDTPAAMDERDAMGVDTDEHGLSDNCLSQQYAAGSWPPHYTNSCSSLHGLEEFNSKEGDFMQSMHTQDHGSYADCASNEAD